jgi:hypothetical protein
LRADFALHAAAALVALFALAGLAHFLARLLPGRVVVAAFRGLRVQRRAGREQRGADDRWNSHETFSFGEIPSHQRANAACRRHLFVTLCFILVA